MQKATSYRVILISIFAIGVILRLSLFYINPPNNSFDDHLEVINIYAKTLNIPSPSQCWECYQPPIYYVIGATILKLTVSIGLSSTVAWKFVQLFNPFLSILVLAFFYKLLLSYNISEIKRILYMSFIAVLPVDLFTASMIGNDYLIVFSAVASFYYYLKIIDNLNNKSKSFYKDFIVLSTFVLIGGLSKQHGLILLAFPSIIVLVLFSRKGKNMYYTLLTAYVLLLILSFSNELWKFEQTGKILISNQDFYDYAKDEEVGPRAGWEAHTSIEETKKILGHFIKSQNIFALEDKATGRAIGSFGFHEILPSLKPYFLDYFGWEIGYVLNRSYWNLGLMTEALEAVIDVFFNSYGLDFFVCGHFEGNEASKRVIEKTGFNYLGNINFRSQSSIEYDTAIYYQWNPNKKDPLKAHVEELF